MANDKNSGYGFESPIVQMSRDPARLKKVLGPWIAERLQVTDLKILDISSPDNSGVANETVMLQAAWPNQHERVTKGFVVRLENPQPLFPEKTIYTQYQMHQVLADQPGIPIPHVLSYEDDDSLLGSPFFVMSRIDGLVPPDRPHFKEGGFVFDASESQRRQLWDSAVQTMARLHLCDTEQFSFLNRNASGKNGLEHELDYWCRFLDSNNLPPCWNRDMLEYGRRWLRDNVPKKPTPGLSWGDARINNMIFQNFQVAAVLDWDTVSLAGPEADLTWWISMENLSGKYLPGIGTPDELIAYWEKLTGHNVQHLHWHLVFSGFRMGTAVMKLFKRMVQAGLISAEGGSPEAPNKMVQTLALWLGEQPPDEALVKLPVINRGKALSSSSRRARSSSFSFA